MASIQCASPDSASRWLIGWRVRTVPSDRLHQGLKRCVPCARCYRAETKMEHMWDAIVHVTQ
ncbi:hypothetical protein COLO4_20796 [Corchorus olitorius]|uniref:Uncharacterized protein n=1 Tax=Corchorus olitorius TaxID=93759 RepID=A0A1R3IWX7_9ROSI|nr:hypothetical protein COLO4_20796 [Corchorus olitorius]